MMIPAAAYSEILADAESKRKKAQQQYSAISWLRLASFLAVLLFFYLALTSHQSLIWFVLSGVSAFVLVALVYLAVITARKRDYFTRLKNLAGNELKALNYDFLGFPDGSDYINNSHFYSPDIDLFGQGSAYQYINRSVTPMGRSNLVHWLENPCLDPQEIKARQASCKELSENPDWRLNFAASAEDQDTGSPENLIVWSQLHDLFRNHTRWLTVIRIWQVIMLVIATTVVAGLLNYRLLILLVLLNLGITGALISRINHVSRLFGNSFKHLASYSRLMNEIGKSGFITSWISERISALGKGENSADSEIGKLRRLLERFDSRNNLLVGFFRDALFLTDISLVIRMETWREHNKANIRLWIEKLGEVDAMNSLATFAFNNPGYCYPEIIGGSFCLDAQQLGHPLIKPEERVCNPFAITSWHTLVVLTGANMAGKSTFLRTVGINHVLAHAGAPVCASAYRFSPVSLITSIRTNDSLIKHESYFYAELKKLKSIIDSLEEGKEVFILLDEVLKGTNSNDKLNGSRILVNKLLGLTTSGIIATHDIALGEMEKEFPGMIVNRCFEASIQDGQLVFDYTLHEGTAQNMTALFLMKQMNIV